eukprot:Plantae.Rhodophyta-Purpureofilum_apyrenoidigerum.ctg23936.p3 GENE.Plantae.Rhodophyta-Purpureofilum_apyrenoidigerum.ctg23936~~Plantae.Rhodophyta-Purpureofilum_apyrenoidigerum.ctg23936.p3  ORF type:complete len:100 (+),score=23.79 Plantae.Rhodophyta-Purpureofilum_apyrenoidigerum.ctg23936:540-839(+)
MAFVGGSSFVGHKVVAKSACTRKTAQFTPMKMAIKKDDGKIIVTTDDIKLEEKRQGFTWWSETWNGRFAMLGFVIAVGTEIINKDHPTIVQQLSALIPS